MLLESALRTDRMELLLLPSRVLAADEAARLEKALARREAREPLQHVIGTTDFYGLELEVDGRVLVPRPETERLVELALAELPVGPGVVLDVGTGSGAVALAVKAERPEVEVIGLDVSAQALDVAHANATRLGLALTLLHSDLLGSAAAAEAAARCDVLVANLPYLPESDAEVLEPEVRADPPIALFGGPDGTAVVSRLIDEAERLLPAGATLALEVDPRNVDLVAARLAAWKHVRVERDLTGRRRFVLATR